MCNSRSKFYVNLCGWADFIPNRLRSAMIEIISRKLPGQILTNFVVPRKKFPTQIGCLRSKSEKWGGGRALFTSLAAARVGSLPRIPDSFPVLTQTIGFRSRRPKQGDTEYFGMTDPRRGRRRLPARMRGNPVPGKLGRRLQRRIAESRRP